MTCKECRYFASDQNECRKNAPTAALVPAKVGGMNVIGFWAGTRPEKWCGQFEAGAAPRQAAPPGNALVLTEIERH